VAAYYLDTIAVLKRYVLETGTARVQALAAPSVRNSLFIARITLAETVAAATRRERGGSITPLDAATAIADFQLDFASQRTGSAARATGPLQPQVRSDDC
jgi:hypothetical protein